MAEFLDVKGQDMAVRLLRNALQSHKISHAYMFVGETGTGKSLLADAFAK
ncbi:MAG: ATP-binding protein, partial [Lachnospiraceae bacterium]|nr:ATP-binding protein [Lachnospiraceae bacterium]